MHSKVDEFYQTVRALQVNHSEADVYTYADPPRFNDDIKKVMDIYVWFEKLKGDALRDASATQVAQFVVSYAP